MNSPASRPSTTSEKLLERGYSSEVTFNGYTESGAGTEFTHLSWPTTLQHFKDTVNEGHDFPLRTPDFLITKDGIVFASFPTPGKLAELQEIYKLDDLRRLLNDWAQSSGNVICLRPGARNALRAASLSNGPRRHANSVATRAATGPRRGDTARTIPRSSMRRGRDITSDGGRW